jgi:hypothetical protein
MSYWWPAATDDCTYDFEMIKELISKIHKGSHILLCCGGASQWASVQAVKLLMVLYGCGWEQASTTWLHLQPTASISFSQVKQFQDQLYSLKLNDDSQTMALNSKRRNYALSCFISG